MANVKIKKATKQGANRRNGTHVNTIRVAAYCRVSTDSEKQLESFNSQKKHYTELINNNPEWQMVGVYAMKQLQVQKQTVDEFNRMINDCMNGRLIYYCEIYFSILRKPCIRWNMFEN